MRGERLPSALSVFSFLFPLSSFLASFSAFRFSRRSLRSCIWRILRAMASSLSRVSMVSSSSLKVFSSSRAWRVRSFSACASRISRMAFSIFLLLSRSSSSACSFALRSISLRWRSIAFSSSS